ncbi:MAG: glycosyltransferase [Candidatus Woesearchaeota archaeon]
MISIVITAFKEPKTIGKAIEAFLIQKPKEKYELIVACPDKETTGVVKKYIKKYKQVKHFKDPGKGKSYCLNMLFKKLKGRIWVFTDGDVYVSKNSLNNILQVFKDKSIGCLSGRVISSNPKDNMLGYWSHLLADAGAHRVRKMRFENKQFLETTGYLFAFRNNGVVKEIPLDVAEDAIIPYYFWKKGYRVGYAEGAVVYVKNPTLFKDWLKQRKRTAGAHETLTKYAPDFPRVKSFKNELKYGLLWIWSYPKKIRELWWTLMLMFARLYMWSALFYDQYFQKKFYQDAWDRVESTK